MRAFVQVLILLSLVVLGFLIYSNTFHSPFHFDDRIHIQNNPHVRMTELSWQEILDVFESRSGTRPVPMLTFALNYYFGRYDVVGYHLVNILIHVTSAILLYFLLGTTLGLLATPLPHPSWAAFLAALLWLVHPVQTQSVTYIVQRMNSMAAMFYILSLLLYVRGRLAQRQMTGSLQVQGTPRKQKARLSSRFLWFAGAGLAGLLAIGSKETAATLPFFVFLYEWYFFQDLSRRWLRRWFPRILCAYAPVVFLGTVHWVLHPENFWDYYRGGFTLPQRVLTEFRVVLYYASLLFYPHPSRLNLDYDFPLSYSLFYPPTTLLSLSVLAGFAGLACWQAKRERLLSFCILWFLGNLMIESSVIPLALVFEHRLYLPSMLVSLAMVAGLYRYVRPKRLATGLLCLVALLLSLWTYQRNGVWTDGVSLWSDTAKKSPNKARPHNNLGEALIMQGNMEEGIKHCREAMRINPEYAEARSNLGLALSSQGRIEEAITQFEEVLRINPEFDAAHVNLGGLLAQQGKLNEAIVHFRQVLQINPRSAEARNNLALALSSQGKMEEAITHLEEVLRTNPELAEAHNNLGEALIKQGKMEEAIIHCREAVRINPEYAKAHSNLGLALLSQGDMEEVIAHCEEALRINPQSAEAHLYLGLALARQNKQDKATDHLRQALRINPQYASLYDKLGVAQMTQGKMEGVIAEHGEPSLANLQSAEAHHNMGIALARRGKQDEAIAHFREAVRMHSGSSEFHASLALGLGSQGKLDEAIDHYREAIRLKTNDPWPYNNLAWIRATHPDPRLRNGAEAIELAERACKLSKDKDPNLLDTLAAAYAEAGRFEEAVATAQEAVSLAASAGSKELISELERRLKDYKLGRPYREADPHWEESGP